MKSTATISDKLTYYSVRAVESILSLIPTSVVWRFGSLLGRIMHVCASKRRKIVHHNLSLVHPEKSEEELAALTKTVFRYSMANLTASVNTACIADHKVNKLITVKGKEHIKALDPDKGVIFMLSHMGNWEVLVRTAQLVDLHRPVGAMYRPLKNPLIDKHLRKKRERAGFKLFSRKRGLIEASKFLRDGNALGIFSDQHSGKSGIHLPLFGKETSITPLPASLAQKFDCPIIPVTLHTTSPGRWTLECLPAFTLPPAAEADKEATGQIIADHLAHIMKTYSQDIFWIHDRWKVKHQFKKQK